MTMIRFLSVALLLAPAMAVQSYCRIRLPPVFGGGDKLLVMDETCCTEITAIPKRSECSEWIKDDLLGHLDTYCHTAKVHGLPNTVCNYDLSQADPGKCVEETTSMCATWGGKLVWNNFTVQCTDTVGKTGLYTESFYKPACMGASCSDEDIQAFMWVSSPDYGHCSFIEINGQSREFHQELSKRGSFFLFVLVALVGIGVAYLSNKWARSRQATSSAHFGEQKYSPVLVEMTEEETSYTALGADIS